MRKLADKNGIPSLDPKDRPKPFELLGTELVKSGVLSEPERKILAGWYGQRNAGAHGGDVIPERVARMIPGVRGLVVRHPA